MAAPYMAVKALLAGIEFVGMTPGTEKTTYEAKIMALTEPGTRARILLNSLTDYPPRIPRNIRLERGERGLVLKGYKVSWDVRPGGKIPERPRKAIEEIAETLTG